MKDLLLKYFFEDYVSISILRIFRDNNGTFTTINDTINVQKDNNTIYKFVRNKDLEIEDPGLHFYTCKELFLTIVHKQIPKFTKEMLDGYVGGIFGDPINPPHVFTIFGGFVTALEHMFRLLCSQLMFFSKPPIDNIINDKLFIQNTESIKDFYRKYIKDQSNINKKIIVGDNMVQIFPDDNMPILNNYTPEELLSHRAILHMKLTNHSDVITHIEKILDITINRIVHVGEKRSQPTDGFDFEPTKLIKTQGLVI